MECSADDELNNRTYVHCEHTSNRPHTFRKKSKNDPCPFN